MVFVFLHLIPGDPAQVMAGQRANPETVAALREQLGLNKPLPVQYFSFWVIWYALTSATALSAVLPLFRRLQLAGQLPLNYLLPQCRLRSLWEFRQEFLAAVRKNSPIDNLTMSGSLIGVSMPVFWLGLLLIYLFAVNLQWLPPGLRLSQDAALTFKPITGFYVLDALLQLNCKVLKDVLAHLLLPALTLSTIPLAIITRITRSAMLEVLSQDYIRTARAKGVLERWVIFKHALKNALLPVVTIIGLQFGALLAGSYSD